MKTFKDYFVLLPVYVICMAVMISDFKLICNIVGSIASLITIIYIYTSNVKADILEKKSIKYIFLFLSYYSITCLYEFDFKSYYTNALYYLMLFTPFFLSIYVFKKGNVGLMKGLVVAFFVIWNIFLYLCLKTCMEDPELARMMTAQRSLYYYVINGGGYYMGYGSAVLSTYLFNNLINGKYHSLFMKLFVIFEILFMLLVVLNIHSFIILVSLLIGCGIAAINRISTNKQSRLFTYIIMGVMALIIYLNIATILTLLIDNTENEFWHKRWTETYEALVLNQNSNHVDAREGVYKISIEGFSKSPIVGVGYQYGNKFDHNATYGVGNHSTILDSLAQYGIIGAIPLFLFLLYPFKKCREDKVEWIHLVPFYTMMYLNPVFYCYHTMVFVFLIIPCMQRLKRINTETQR